MQLHAEVRLNRLKSITQKKETDVNNPTLIGRKAPNRKKIPKAHDLFLLLPVSHAVEAGIRCRISSSSFPLVDVSSHLHHFCRIHHASNLPRARFDLNQCPEQRIPSRLSSASHPPDPNQVIFLLYMDDPISFHPTLFSQTLPAGNEVEEFSSSDPGGGSPNHAGNTQVFSFTSR
ncbi:hypothetical protein CKAN_00990900 [Cinnamomum micranthum f. kanehirae]|uniref:Uncharacterized protein n=1 Tax=Cinnamomum micranthum f. kanehirae TaxID=337451 RepID=A0A3S3MCU3_9MAGN|nr:hypothetical protein CKAN_00990900 [Cinnamomum micranthum f. kanehirae]